MLGSVKVVEKGGSISQDEKIIILKNNNELVESQFRWLV